LSDNNENSPLQALRKVVKGTDEKASFAMTAENSQGRCERDVAR